LVAHVHDVDPLLTAPVVDREQVAAGQREQLGDPVRLQALRHQAAAVQRGALLGLGVGAHARLDAISHSRMAGAGLETDFGGTFPFEPRYAESEGVRIHYVDEGPRDAPTLLFVHGNPTWSYMWRRPIAALAEQGRRCIAFDHMGFGRSDKPPQLARYSLQAHIDH